MILSSAAGGTRAPIILDWVMWLSNPNVYAECVKPDKSKQSKLKWNDFDLHMI